MHRLAFVLLPALALAAGLVWAEDAAKPAGPSPAERMAKVRASLPPPSAQGGYAFDAEVFLGGVPFGTVSYRVVAAGTPDAPRWEASEHAQILGGAKPQTQDTKALLGADLRLLSYERRAGVEGAAPETTVVDWPSPRTLRIVRKDREGHESSSTTADSDASAMGTLAGLLLFARLAPADPAVYEVPLYVNESTSVQQGRVEVVGPGALVLEGKSVPAHLVRVSMGGRVFELYLQPQDRTPFAVRQVQRDILFAAKGLVEPKAAPPVDTTKPAASAREVGMRFALGVLTGDTALLTASLHWPTILQAEKERSGFTGDEAALREVWLSRMKPTMQDLPRERAETLVRAASGKAVETVVGDLTEVRFGAPMEGFAYRARAVGGVWYVVQVEGGR